MGEPKYKELLASGELAERANTVRRNLTSCTLCPRQCQVDRINGERGACQTGALAIVSSTGPHHGEEEVIRGYGGSGTIFFAGCNLGCVYCQNHDISQGARGTEAKPDELAQLMIDLQDAGCHNINLVTPSHVISQILDALIIAAERGLKLPLVYNTGGYDRIETLQFLDGIVDVYMPDMKYGLNETGQRLSGVPDYVDVNRAAVHEMYRQVGDLVLDRYEVAARGLLIRHLVLPGMLEETRSILEFLADEISLNTYVNVMAQYRPAYQATEYPPVGDPLSPEDHQKAMDIAEQVGLLRLDRGRRSF